MKFIFLVSENLSSIFGGSRLSSKQLNFVGYLTVSSSSILTTLMFFSHLIYIYKCLFVGELSVLSTENQEFLYEVDVFS